jgi:hypothetical protein
VGFVWRAGGGGGGGGRGCAGSPGLVADSGARKAGARGRAIGPLELRPLAAGHGRDRRRGGGGRSAAAGDVAAAAHREGASRLRLDWTPLSLSLPSPRPSCLILTHSSFARRWLLCPMLPALVAWSRDSLVGTGARCCPFWFPGLVIGWLELVRRAI